MFAHEQALNHLQDDKSNILRERTFISNRLSPTFGCPVRVGRYPGTPPRPGAEAP